MSKRKKKPRARRHLAPVERRGGAADEPTSESKLKRAAFLATALGVASLAAALGIQYQVLPIQLGGSGVLVLKVAGGALVIAGFIFGRGAKK